MTSSKAKLVQEVSTLHPSSYYATFYEDSKNPVFVSFNKEVNEVKRFVIKNGKNDAERTKCGNMVFDLFNKYYPLLPPLMFTEQLVEMGDFLSSCGQYQLALWNSYDRYLRACGDQALRPDQGIEQFKAAFFPNGLGAENAGLTFRALMGKVICTYRMVLITDARLQNEESLGRCLDLLKFLRLITQVVLKSERLCWLIYNGTIHIYSISRQLMSLGFSEKVLEYLLWCSAALEVSIPLMTAKYLGWRATIYTAVCQCFYDCNRGVDAEAFARRALAKINDLSELEKRSSEQISEKVELVFREATVKMAAMVFKRTAIETRGRPKGVFKPKQRINFRDIGNQSWPRTGTEKLLADMFDGSAAQFLAVLECASDPKRRVFQHGPAAPDNESEILDVFIELFLAGKEILMGGTSVVRKPMGAAAAAAAAAAAVAAAAATGAIGGMPGIVADPAATQLGLATRGADGVTLRAAVTFARWAFHYEQWEVFDWLSAVLIPVLKEPPAGWDAKQLEPDVRILELLQAMKLISANVKQKKASQLKEAMRMQQQALEQVRQQGGGAGGGEGDAVKKASKDDAAKDDSSKQQQQQQQSQQPGGGNADPDKAGAGEQSDDLLGLTNALVGIIDGDCPPEAYQTDILLDAVIYLWQRCKAVLQKHQTGSDSGGGLHKLDNPNKWVHVLATVHRSLAWLKVASVDAAMAAEVVLRLALIVENHAVASPQQQHQPQQVSSVTFDASAGAMDPAESIGHMVSVETMNMLKQPVKEQLQSAKRILEIGLRNVSDARSATVLADGRSVCDVVWSQEVNPHLFEPQTDADFELSRSAVKRPEDLPPDANAVWSTVKDLQVELLSIYHRVSLRLAELEKLDYEQAEARKIYPRGVKPPPYPGFDQLYQQANRNGFSRALLCAQNALRLEELRASSSFPPLPGARAVELIDEAISLMSKHAADEESLYRENVAVALGTAEAEEETKGDAPPAPILLSRTDTEMTLRPGRWAGAARGVAWYRIFARPVTGSNVKVRLCDDQLCGAGVPVPAFNCQFRVHGLQPNQKYVFAVAAYDAEGRLVGSSIGPSTRPILASHPSPLITGWALLAQAAYRIGAYAAAKRICETHLWRHFVARPVPPSDELALTSRPEFRLNRHRVNRRILSLTSPIQLRLFIECLLIGADIATVEKRLYCDSLCDAGPAFLGQAERLRQCEAALLAMDAAMWLNDAAYALQAVVTAYGLLAPLVHYKMQTRAVLQVLQRCVAVLLEIPPAQRLRKSSSKATQSLAHMIACITYYLSRTLRTWREDSLAASMLECGRKLLQPEVDQPTGNAAAAAAAAAAALDAVSDIGDNVGDMIRKRKKKPGAGNDRGAAGAAGNAAGGADGDNTNEELIALEEYMLSTTRSSGTDAELTGNEDPSILHAYVAFLPSRVAYKEVSKFRKRMRYIEFFVKVAEKGLSEGHYDLVIEWTKETTDYLDKRNELYTGVKHAKSKDGGATRAAAANAGSVSEQSRIPGASVSEFKVAQGAAEGGDTSNRGGKKRQQQGNQQQVKKKYKDFYHPSMKDLPPEALAAFKPMRTTPTMTESQRQLQEEVETKALEVLTAYLPELVKRHAKRKRFRKLCAEERPWRSDMCLVLGLAHFGNFFSKLDLRLRQLGIASNIHKSSYMDPEWFTMDAVGALLFNWQRAKAAEDTSGPGVGLKASKQAASGPLAPKSNLDRAAAACLGNPTAEDFLRSVQIVAVVGNEEANRLAKEKLFKESEPEGGDAAAGKVPRSARGKKSVDFDGNPGGPPVTQAALIDCLDRCFRCLRRAGVLAGRGAHWSLLVRCGQTVWSCLQTALMQIGCHQQAMDAALLRRTAWEAMWTVCDQLIDCLQRLQAESASAAAKRIGASLPTDLPLFSGGPEVESGGASLRFDADMDDASTLDLRWLRKFALATLEVLHQERKWERLVDLGLRFNAVTNNRYCELTTPLIVKAQRSLADRVLENGGPAPPQPHYRFLLRQREDRPIGSRDYLELQLVTAIDKRKLQPTRAEPADPQKPQEESADEAADVFARDPQEIYENGLVARQLSCVPLDTETSLDEFRRALDATSSTSKSLQHARQLALLYMAGQQEGATGYQRPSSSGVQFRDVTDKPPTALPPDRRANKFTEEADCSKLPLPRSQLPIVVEAYEKAIELLSAKKQKSLAAQAYRELGCLFLHLDRPRDALFYWSECLDCVLGVEDALNNWRSLVGSSDAPTVLMQRCGVWGCILGGIAASNIAQYIMSSDLGLRLDCCFLAAGFFKGLFRSSLPHPLSDRDYAMYDIGEQCEVTSLMPGVSLLGNRFRADVRVWEAALSFVIEELTRAGHNTAVLPLLSLYLYLVTGLARDLHRSVKGRVKRLEVLTSLSLYSEACTTLKQLLWGERLPQLIDSKYRTTETRPPKFVFDASKSLLSEENLHALDKLSHRRLTPSLAALYGQHLVCRVTLAQSSLLSSIAASIQALPEKINFEAVELDPALLLSPERGRRGGGGGGGGGGAKRTMAGKFQTEDLKQPKSPIGLAQLALQQQSRQLSPEILKFLLLRASGDALQAMLDSLLPQRDDDDEASAALNATELELAIGCLLGLSRVARERHHARTAARFAQRALRLLAMSDLLSPGSRIKRPKRRQQPQSSSKPAGHRLTSEEELENFASRARLDARTWLNCRLALADSLLCELRGMGNVKGAERGVYVDVPDARAAILQGIGETEMLGDAELRREFQFRLATLDLLEGRPTPQVLESLMVVNSAEPAAPSGGKAPQQPQQPQSEASALTRIHCSVLIADLLMCQSLDPQELDRALTVYSQGHERLLRLIEQRGETVEHHLKQPVRSSPSCPMANIYLPEYLLLVQVKLRIAYTLAKMGSQESVRSGKPKQLWTEAVGIAVTALELSQAVANRSAMLESELWTVLGKLQLQLHLLGYFSQRTVAKTLYEALKSVIHSHHDLAAIRQLYLDLALLHLFNCGLVSVASNGSLVGAAGGGADESAAAAAAAGASSPINSPKTRTRRVGGAAGGGGGGGGKRKPLSKRERDEAQQREATEVHRDRRAAWVAIKCAARVGAAQRSLSAIVGESNGSLTTDQAAGVPEPAAFDLAAAYVLGRKKRIYKSEIEEELSTMDEAAIVEDSEVYADQLERVVKATEGIAWNSLLGYHGLLLRLCVNKSVEPDTDSLEIKEEVEGLEFPLVFPDIVKGFVARPVVRTPLAAAYWSQRLPSLHRFFVDNLPAYKTACTAVYPPEPLRPEQADMDMSQELADLGAVYRSYRRQWEQPVDEAAAAEAEEVSSIDILSAAQAAGIDVSTLKTLPTGNAKRSQQQQQPPRPPGYAESVYKPSELGVMSVNMESDLSVQFYRPPLDVMCSKSAYRKTLMLFASTVKVDKNVSWLKSIQCGALTVDLEDLVRLFGRFRLLAQQADLALRKAATSAAAASGSTTSAPTSGGGAAASGGGATSAAAAGGAAGDDKGASSVSAATSAGDAATVGSSGGGGAGSKKQKLKPPVEKSRTERLIEALARESLDDLHRLVTGSAPQPRCFAVQGPLPSQEEMDKMPEEERPLEIPFEINRENLQHLKQVCDPDLGGSVKTGKLLNYLLSVSPAFRVE